MPATEQAIMYDIAAPFKGSTKTRTKSHSGMCGDLGDLLLDAFFGPVAMALAQPGGLPSLGRPVEVHGSRSFPAGDIFLKISI